MRVLLLNPPGPNGQGFIREGRCHQRLSSYIYRMIPISLPSIAGLLREGGLSASPTSSRLNLDSPCLTRVKGRSAAPPLRHKLQWPP